VVGEGVQEGAQAFGSRGPPAGSPARDFQPQPGGADAQRRDGPAKIWGSRRMLPKPCLAAEAGEVLPGDITSGERDAPDALTHAWLKPIF
jgi:hypothetical protein